jgi:ADP-heptose:LPS heptosyltransferase
MTSILVIRLTSLGDVILATPVIAALHEAYPDAGIDVVVDASYAEVWRHNPHLRSVHCVSRGDDAIPGLPAYDLVVDLQKNKRSSRIINRVRSVANPKVIAYSKHRLEKLAFVYLKRKPTVVTHIVDRYMDPLHQFGVSIADCDLELWTASGRARKLQQTTNGSAVRIGIAPGAQHATKRYPAALFAQLVRSLVLDHHVEVVTIGGPADRASCDEIIELAGVSVTRADGSTSLAATLDVLTGLDALVSCDSAAVHMASACKVPVVVVYGSTAPEFGFTPYKVPHAIVQTLGLDCRPCTHIGRSRCPKGHFHCMRRIMPSTIIEDVLRLCPTSN